MGNGNDNWNFLTIIGGLYFYGIGRYLYLTKIIFNFFEKLPFCFHFDLPKSFYNETFVVWGRSKW
jgi:hypothetical protein